MRTLVISMNFPDDLGTRVHGIFQRLSMFIEALKGMGELDLLFFVEQRIDVSPAAVLRYQDILAEHYSTDLHLMLVSRDQPAPETRWEAYGAGALDGFRQQSFRWANGPHQLEALETALDRQPDLLFVHRLGPMAAVLKTCRRLPPICFDLDDLEHRAFCRGIPSPPHWPAKRLYYLQVPALWWAERRSISKASRTFVCSENDRDYLTRTMRVDGVTVVPNAIEIPEPFDTASERIVLFIGVLSYPPNRNAAAYLLRDIWPRVRDLVPDARLLVVGSYPEGVPGYPGGENGVTFTGFVPDLSRLYERTKVACVPIRAGGGTRIKIIEAAGYGRPVVSTTIGAEGLSMEDGRSILLRDDPESFAQALADLLLDDVRNRELGLAAHEAVQKSYARENVIRQIQAEVGQLL